MCLNVSQMLCFEKKMPIDKKWTSVKNLLSVQYKTSAKQFVQWVANYVNVEGKVRSPCGNCLNALLQPLGLAEIHLVQYGIQQSYTVCSFHEKSFHAPANNEESTEVENDEMAYVLQDIARHEGLGETSHTFVKGIEEITAELDKFNDMFNEIKRQLYLGCEKFLTLNFLVKLMYLKVLNK